MPDLETSFPEPPRPQPTGRLIVTFDPGRDVAEARNIIQNQAGIRALDIRELGDRPLDPPSPGGAEGGFVFSRFGVAVIETGGDTSIRAASLATVDGVRSVRPEFYLFAISELERRYADWVRAGLALLIEGGPRGSDVVPAATRMRTRPARAGEPGVYADTDRWTWGLAAVGANQSPLTGKGVRAAILDTGLDLEHPDFKGRPIVARSFVPDGTVMDVQGHGTHTAGTLAGPSVSKIGRRYGVAPDVSLHIGKVLDDGGSGTEADILRAVNWAIDSKCAVISMSLGRPTQLDEAPDPLYEEVGSAALREGCLIVAAAGNESARSFGYVAPVGAPANSPSIMAVAAVDPRLAVAPFSCGGLAGRGGEVDISGPGTLVYSSFPRPRLARPLQGTSMACPHVAGVAALLAETDPGLRGRRLWDRLIELSREIGPTRDYGSGLVQVPPSVGA
ncbi:MAG: S8 family serine peptidase [Methylobacterium frigidaeris]